MNFLSQMTIMWITKYASPTQWSKIEVSRSLSHLKPTSECRRLMFPSLLLLLSLQKIIRRNDGTETECTERDGWCLPKTSDDLRDTMSLMIKQIIRSTRPGKDAHEHQSILLPCCLLLQCITTFLMVSRPCGLNKDVAVSTGAVAFLYLPPPLCYIWCSSCSSALQCVSWGCCPAAWTWVGIRNGWE